MKQALNFPQFLKAIRHYTVDDIEAFLKDVRRYYQMFPEYQYAGESAGIYIVAYPLRRYIYANEQFARMSEVPLSGITDYGLESNQKKIYAPDRAIHHNAVFPNAVDLIRGKPADERDSYVMGCNYRCVNRDGPLRSVLQQSRFIKSAAAACSWWRSAP